jgi:hypothetical protein
MSLILFLLNLYIHTCSFLHSFNIGSCRRSWCRKDLHPQLSLFVMKDEEDDYYLQYRFPCYYFFLFFFSLSILSLFCFCYYSFYYYYYYCYDYYYHYYHYYSHLCMLLLLLLFLLLLVLLLFLRSHRATSMYFFFVTIHRI